MKPPPVPRPMIGGGAIGTTVPPWKWRNFAFSRAIMRVDALILCGPLLERLQRHDQEGGIGLRVIVDEVQPNNEV